LERWFHLSGKFEPIPDGLAAAGGEDNCLADTYGAELDGAVLSRRVMEHGAECMPMQHQGEAREWTSDALVRR
jgi:hypothetical protein